MNKTIFTLAIAGLLSVTACNQAETASTPSVAKQSNNTDASNNGTSVNMAYVNMDSLQVNYLHYKRIADQLKVEIEKADQDVRNKTMRLQENYQKFQEMAPEMTQEELQYYSQDLQQSEQKIMAQQQALETELMQKQQIVYENLKVELDSVLEIIKVEKNLDFIFTYPLGSGLLAVNERFDITISVTAALNELHKEEAENVEE